MLNLLQHIIDFNWLREQHHFSFTAGNIHGTNRCILQEVKFEDLPKGTVNVSSNVSDYGRILTIFGCKD